MRVEAAGGEPDLTHDCIDADAVVAGFSKQPGGGVDNSSASFRFLFPGITHGQDNMTIVILLQVI